MNFRVLIAPACFLLLGACTTYPAQTASNTDVEAAVAKEVAPADATAVVDEEIEESLSTVVCRRTIITGSRFKRKVCMTRRQWRDLQSRTQKDIEDVQRMNTQTNNPQGG